MWRDDGKARSLLAYPIKLGYWWCNEYWGEVDREGKPHGFGIEVENGKKGLKFGYWAHG